MIEQKGLDFKFEQKTQAKPEMIDNPPARHALPFLTLGILEVTDAAVLCKLNCAYICYNIYAYA